MNAEEIGNFKIEFDEPIKFTTESHFEVGGKKYKCPIPQDNEYHEFKVRYNEGEVEFYVDGRLTPVVEQLKPPSE